MIINQSKIKKFSAIIAIMVLFNVVIPYGAFAKTQAQYNRNESWGNLRYVEIYNPDSFSCLEYKVIKSRYIPVTAYTSHPWETDSTPFTTASGVKVRDGIIAANFLPFGTLVRFPDYFGNKVFEVQDRMNPRYYYQADIWMPNKEEAKAFGRKILKIEILELKQYCELKEDIQELTLR